MNRRSLALAVASVFAVPPAALAEGANVQIYSTINVDFEGVQTTGATAAGALPPGQCCRQASLPSGNTDG